MAFAFNVMRTLCGAAWVPVEVHLAHRAPSDRRPYRRLFQAPVVFDAAQNTMVFERHWLLAPLAKPHATVPRSLEPAIAAAARTIDDDQRIQARRAIVAAIVAGDVTVRRVAAAFGVSQRTLNRLLAKHKSSARELIKEGRFRIARQLLSDTLLTVAEIALMLGYAEPSVFVRAFRRWADLSPATWRHQQKPMLTRD